MTISPNYPHPIIRQLVSRKPPERFDLDKDPITGEPIEPDPPQKKLPLGPSGDPFSTTEKARKLIDRHKPQKPKGRGK